MNELVKRYEELYEDMVSSKDPKKMIVFGEAEKKIFRSLTQKHPDVADMWLTWLEAGKWNNYLSKSEAERIVGGLQNQDGSRGPRWDYSAFKTAVESLGASVADEPFYNCYALWATANMLYSDHAKTIGMLTGKEEFPKVFYMLAVEQLKDTDRPRFVREYFSVDD